MIGKTYKDLGGAIHSLKLESDSNDRGMKVGKHIRVNIFFNEVLSFKRGMIDRVFRATLTDSLAIFMIDRDINTRVTLVVQVTAKGP